MGVDRQGGFMKKILLWVNGNATREIKTEIEISAPASELWAILTDIDDWENWSP